MTRRLGENTQVQNRIIEQVCLKVTSAIRGLLPRASMFSFEAAQGCDQLAATVIFLSHNRPFRLAGAGEPGRSWSAAQ